MNKIKIFTTILGILNIILGLLFALILILMQGLVIFLLGLVYIFLGIGMLGNKFRYKLFYAVMLITVLFSFFIIMLGIDKSIPKYAQTPIEVGIIILLPFWFVTLADSFFFIYLKTKTCQPQRK